MTFDLGIFCVWDPYRFTLVEWMRDIHPGKRGRRGKRVSRQNREAVHEAKGEITYHTPELRLFRVLLSNF